MPSQAKSSFSSLNPLRQGETYCGLCNSLATRPITLKVIMNAKSVKYANAIVDVTNSNEQPRYGTIHETTCHLIFYAALGATRRN